jgi:hypothetical protein
MFVQLSAAGHHTCGITLDERLVCWGGGGAGVSLPASLHALSVPASAHYLQVTAGTNHVCALTHEGAIKCWGEQGRRARARPGARGCRRAAALPCAAH